MVNVALSGSTNLSSTVIENEIKQKIKKLEKTRSFTNQQVLPDFYAHFQYIHFLNKYFVINNITDVK